MKFVRLVDAEGNDNWVNPSKVLAVAVLPETGHTVLVLEGNIKGAVKGTPAEVAAALSCEESK